MLQTIQTTHAKINYACSRDSTCAVLHLINIYTKLSLRMRKPAICIGENKGADQLRSNCEADQRLCFRYTDSTISLLLISKVSSL